MYVHNFGILCTVHDIKLIYITTFTFPEIHYTHQTFVNFIHFSTRYGCHQQGVLSFANVAPSKWSVEKYVGKHNHTLVHALKFSVTTPEWSLKDQC